ncbi:PH domain-containing protein [Streptomyces fragilis]|uniref:PH domain-containing protein n=1 Tax=Streptomyces fragilis TaxID=67301 RepID=A0ABV2YIM8_9ACTN|nr:PH domain-containing protein [Streptomyces fragilis]
MNTSPTAPTSPDTVYRSPMALAGGVLTLLVVGGLAVDAFLHGSARAVWTAVGVLLLVVPVVVAFTFRPAVLANEERLRVRNPLRMVTLPWGQVAGFRSGLSHEVLTEDGRKFELWALPVSLRDRRKTLRKAERAGERGRSAAPAGLGSPGAAGPGGVVDEPPRRGTDQIVGELRERWERQVKVSTAQGEVTVRWAYELIAPVLAGLIVLLVLRFTG